MDKPQKASDQKPPKPSNEFLKYSGLGLQIMLVIGGAGMLGYYLDQKLTFNFPLFLLLFTMGSLVGTIYLLIRGTK